VRKYPFISCLVLACLVGVFMSCIVTHGMADTGTGYWNFSLDTFTELTPVNPADSSLTTINESILPGDPLYTLKLSFEHLDQSFTSNTTIRIEKQMHYTENRLAESEEAFRANRSEVAELALKQYFKDLDATLKNVAALPEKSPEHARAQIVAARHLTALNRTIHQHPGRGDVLDAYNRTSDIAVKKPAPTQTETVRKSTANTTVAKAHGVKGQNLTMERSEPATNSTHVENPEIRRPVANSTTPTGKEGQT
jgi:hypothetical protein